MEERKIAKELDNGRRRLSEKRWWYVWNTERTPTNESVSKSNERTTTKTYSAKSIRDSFFSLDIHPFLYRFSFSLSLSLSLCLHTQHLWVKLSFSRDTRTVFLSFSFLFFPLLSLSLHWRQKSYRRLSRKEKKNESNDLFFSLVGQWSINAFFFLSPSNTCRGKEKKFNQLHQYCRHNMLQLVIDLVVSRANTKEWERERDRYPSPSNSLMLCLSLINNKMTKKKIFRTQWFNVNDQLTWFTSRRFLMMIINYHVRIR